MSKAKIHLSIHTPDTTIIHRAGVLGLWMTLKQLELEFPEPKDRLGRVSWHLTNHSISIDWEGEDLNVLDWLLKQSFRLTDQGIIQLTGLQKKPIPLENQIHLHQTILATLLQYNGSVKALQKSYFESVDIQVKDIKLGLSYKPITSYFYQNFASELCDKKTRQLRYNQYIPIVSRLYPGAILQHHLIGSKNQCREKMEYAFALLFVPIASQFLTLSQEIKKQISSEKSHPTEYLIIIPEPTNLESDANIRWNNINEDFSTVYVSHPAEGVFNFYKQLNSECNNNHQCQVITYGKVIHGSRTRGVIDNKDYLVEPNMIKQYCLLDSHFKPNQILPTNKNFLVRINLIKGIIANNLLSKQPIWKNLWLIIRDQDSYGEIREALKYKRITLYDQKQSRNNQSP